MSPRARCHHHARRRRQAHGGVDTFSVVNGCQAGPRSQVREDHPAVGLVSSDKAFELLHQIGIRQPVKAIAANAGGFITARNWHDLGDPGHVMMKTGIKAPDLRQLRKETLETLNQGDFRGKVVDIQQGDSAELGDQFGRDQLGPVITRPSMHDPMPHTKKGLVPDVFRQPVDE